MATDSFIILIFLRYTQALQVFLEKFNAARITQTLNPDCPIMVNRDKFARPLVQPHSKLFDLTETLSIT